MPIEVQIPQQRIKTSQEAFNTRIGIQIQHKPIIIIDKREFKQDLPAILYHEVTINKILRDFMLFRLPQIQEIIF